MRIGAVLLAITASLVSGALLYIGTGLHPTWWLVWLAPIPVLAIAPRISGWAAFLLGLLAWVIGELNQWNYLTRVLGIPLPIVTLFLLIPAIGFGLGVLFVRGFLQRGWVLFAALALPVYWVTYEYLTEVTSPHSTFGNLGYSQMGSLALIQVAAVTGIWGISFVVFLFAGTFATLVSGAGERSRRVLLGLTVIATIALVFLFGLFRLHTTSAAQRTSVTLLAKDVPMSVYVGPEEQGLALLREYADAIQNVTPPGTQVVVLPEKIARLSENNLPQVDAMFAQAAAATHSAVVVGLVRKAEDGGFNSARFYEADGKLAGNYDKHHLLPGVEPEKPGDKRVLLDQPNGRWGLQICKDMDFPRLSREYAGENANLLLVPAWDFNVDGWLHARMAMLRAVENGFALARSARNGLLTLSDNRGRIIAETSTANGHFVSITGTVSIAVEKTFYSHTGDWFAWFCILALVVLLIIRFRKTKSQVT